MDCPAFLHIMLAVAISILVLDVFTGTEFLSWVSLLIFAAWGTWQIEPPWQWAVLIFIIFLGLGCALYYTVWNLFVRRIFMGIFLRKSPKEFNKIAEGKIVYVLGDKKNFYVDCEDFNTALDKDYVS